MLIQIINSGVVPSSFVAGKTEARTRFSNFTSPFFHTPEQPVFQSEDTKYQTDEMAALHLPELVNTWNCSCGYNNATGSETCAGTVKKADGTMGTCGKLRNTA